MSVLSTGDGTVSLAWTSPTDDNTQPVDLEYKLVHADSEANLDTAAEAAVQAGVYAPYATREETVSNLNNDSPHYFAVLTWDNADQWSISNIVAATPTAGPSSACDLVSFSGLPDAGSFMEPVAAVVTTGASSGTVVLTLPAGTDVTKVYAYFTLSADAKLRDASPAYMSSGTSYLDLTSPVTLTVVAEDTTTTKDYTVSVTFAPIVDLCDLMLNVDTAGFPDIPLSPAFGKDQTEYSATSTAASITSGFHGVDLSQDIWVKQ